MQMKDSGAPPALENFQSKWLILFAVMLGSIMGPLDGSIVNTVLPSLTNVFHTDISIVQWVPSIYLLTISCLILLFGRLGDMVGYKKVFLSGMAAFIATSALCGISQSIWMLIAFRALQGLAASAMMSVSFAIITAAFPPTERGKALGISAVGIAVGLAAGPTLGGVITEHLNWRFIFFVNVPVGISALFLASRVIPQSSRRPGQHLDWHGALTAFVFLISLLLYADRGESWGWLSAGEICLLVIALIFGVAFFVIERTSVQPMLNLTLFANRIFAFASLSALFSFMAAYAVIFLTPFYLTFVLHFDIEKVGWIMASSPVATLCVAPLSGVVSDRIGTRGLAFCGMAISALSLYLLSELKASSGSFDIMWRLGVFGLGSGIFQSPNNSTVMGNVPRAQLGVASGILAAMRNVGMALGIAIAGAILYNVAPVALSGNPGSFTSSDIQEFMSGLRWAYIGGALLAGAAALAALMAAGRRTQVQQKDRQT
jgi:EmrB/QacA subfamily drug resistance transporter